MVRGKGFNPFSFRSPSKRVLSALSRGGTVSIPSPSGLLQNGQSTGCVFAFPVSIPSPSGLLQNADAFASAAQIPFQSLLLQVSFKTVLQPEVLRLSRFNPFSFRSPSKRGLLRIDTCRCRFNPFSFRSPSKRSRALWRKNCRVSIPSPSGLLQNRVAGRFLYRSGRFNPFSFRSPSKQEKAAVLHQHHSFNPFSFRSPSKLFQEKRQMITLKFQSLLLQVSFKTSPRPLWTVSVRFQSLLLQVSFKTTVAAEVDYVSAFQSLLLQVSFKTELLDSVIVCRLFQSLLLQVSFKTQVETNFYRTNCFNPFSFRSPSKPRRGQRDSGRTVVFQSLLLQVSFKTGRSRECASAFRFNPFSFRSPSKPGRDQFSTDQLCFNPFSFRSPSKPSVRVYYSKVTEFQSLLLQVSFKTAAEARLEVVVVSIPSPSGLLQNLGRRDMRRKRDVSIPSPSGLLQNSRSLRRCT